MKRIRSWWLAAAVCAVLAAALLLPQRLLQQKLDRVAETEFSVDGAEPDMEEDSADTADDSSEDMIDPNEELVPIDEAPGMSADGNVEGIE